MIDTSKRTGLIYAIDFANGCIRIDSNDFKGFTVRLVKESDVGDWKTAASRNLPMSYKEGTIGYCTKIWDNFYGRWARVTIGGREVDLDPYHLECLAEDDELQERYYVNETITRIEISKNSIRLKPPEEQEKYFWTFAAAKILLLL